MSAQKRRGFSLIELMIAISIIAILSVIGITAYTQGQRLARDSKRKQDLKEIQKALALYYQDFKRYPCSGAAGWAHSSSADWLTDSNACSYGAPNLSLVPDYITAMPTDPVLNETNSESAGKRGYAYYSIDGIHGSCTAGQYYVLVTHLENASDPETLSADRTICGSVVYTLIAYGDNAYIVSQP